MDEEKKEALQRIIDYVEKGIERSEIIILAADEIDRINEVSKKLSEEACSETKEKLKSLGYL
jgi:hypothetical protein